MKFNLTLVQRLVLCTCQIYNIFGSGANHSIHAQFIAQASILNNGYNTGLLRGAGTCFGTWFYAMHRLLCQTRHSMPQFMELHLHLCLSTIKWCLLSKTSKMKCFGRLIMFCCCQHCRHYATVILMSHLQTRYLISSRGQRMQFYTQQKT